MHVCDSLCHDGGHPDESVLRDVPAGGGVPDLQEWVDAVKATGYAGWWSGELFCRKQHQDDSSKAAAGTKRLLKRLVL